MVDYDAADYDGGSGIPAGVRAQRIRKTESKSFRRRRSQRDGQVRMSHTILLYVLILNYIILS